MASAKPKLTENEERGAGLPFGWEPSPSGELEGGFGGVGGGLP